MKALLIANVEAELVVKYPLFFLAIGISLFSATNALAQQRVRAGLQVLFDSNSFLDSGIQDQSGMGKPIRLNVETPKTVDLDSGFIQFKGRSVVRSGRRADKIHHACCWTNEITVEAWVQPADVNQKGPARVVTFSRNGSARNFTLGQEGDRFDFRLRTNRTSANGTPSLSTPRQTVSKKVTHLVYARQRSGTATFWVDGKPVANATVPGDFSNWDINFRLLLGNEQSDDRTWRGKIFLVAVYNRALSTAEVQQNYEAGTSGSTPRLVRENRDDPFRKHVAPVMALRCLECHDSISKKGGLDLSNQRTAFKADSGNVIEKGKSSESLLWKMVESGEMPPDRQPLTDKEKQALKNWIDQGAEWTVETIDPAVFLRSRSVEQQLIRRLTVNEYISTVKQTTGVDVEELARKLLPKDIRADGFDNTAYNLNVDLKHVEVYARLAEEVVSRLQLVDFARRFHGKSLTDKKFNDEDAKQLIRKMGQWVLRGNLDAAEEISLLNVVQVVRQGGGTYLDSIRGVLQVMLQSPRFLYQIERQRGDGELWPVDPFTLANRASYIAWGAPPDKELFELAANGQLAKPAVYRQQVERLMSHSNAKQHSQEFLRQWLNLNRLSSLRPDSEKYPDWNPDLGRQMSEETIRFWNEIVWTRKESLRRLFDADVTFVTAELAKHYGMIQSDSKKNQKLNEPGWHQVDLADVAGRRGLLTQGSVLTIGGDEASMVTRGLFVLDDVLRGVVNDPPACVDTTPKPTRAGLTQRLMAIERIKDKNCGGCHSRFEPLAFGFEKFDGLGRYRTADEHGNQLREDGEMLIPGESRITRYSTSKEFAQRIAASDRVLETLTWKLTQFSIGRPLGPGDLDASRKINKKALAEGATYQAFIRAILHSDLVMLIKTEPYPKVPE